MANAIAAAPEVARRIGTGTLLRVLWRSFFFQSATNYERMQNVGFAYCMLPALTQLYQGPALQAAMARHLEFFNTHPYMADALLGATVRLEEEVAAGQASAATVQSFKRCTMGPMAALGDSFFWSSLKPFGAAWAIAGVLTGIAWAPLAFLVLYNMFHLTIRIYGIFAGYRYGQRVVEQLNRFELPRLANRAHYLAGLFLGIGAALIADAAMHSTAALGDGLEPVLLALLTGIFLLCLKRKMPMLVLMYGFAGACVGLVLGLNALFPLIG